MRRCCLFFLCSCCCECDPDSERDALRKARVRARRAAKRKEVEALARIEERKKVAAGGAVLTDDQLAKIKALYLDAFLEPLPNLMRDQAGIMADMMTLGEITALTDFYATPEGKSVMAKLPQLTAAQQPALNGFIGAKMDELVPQVLAIVNGEAAPAATAEPTTTP